MSRTSSDGRRVSRIARRRAAIAAVGLVAALGLSGCGNQPAQPGAAAVVGENRVTVSDLQTAYREINDVAQGPGGQPVPQTTLLGWLMLEPFVVPEAAEAGVAVSEDDARALLDQLKAQTEAQESPTPSPTPEAEPSPDASPTSSPTPSTRPGRYSAPTLAAIRSYLSIQNMAQQLAEEQPIKQWWNQVLDEVDKGNPHVSPRYGVYTRPDVDNAASFDELLNLIGTSTPNWWEGANDAPSLVPGETPQPEVPEDMPTEEGVPQDPSAEDPAAEDPAPEPSPTATP